MLDELDDHALSLEGIQNMGSPSERAPQQPHALVVAAASRAARRLVPKHERIRTNHGDELVVMYASVKLLLSARVS